MMKINFLNSQKSVLMLLIMFVTTILFGQTEKAVYKKIAGNFELNFNEGNYSLIFDCFSPEMQKALPNEQSIDFFSGIKSQAGKIVERQFIKYQQTAAVYKTKFERAVFTLLISVDNKEKINGLYIKPFIEIELPKPDRNKTKLILPFNDEWAVVWGGDNKKQNYHAENEAQRNAFDFVIRNKNGLSYKTDGKTNEDYYAFGKEIIAPCDGEIVLAVDGVKDNVPWTVNPVYLPGNTVILKTQNNEYMFIAHFKQHSIRVKQGQKVNRGELLGLCGNSGNSTEPHIHFHIQNTEDMNIATGIKCYFDKIRVNDLLRDDYSPVQGEKIKPE